MILICHRSLLFLFWTFETLAGFFNLVPADAVLNMVIDQAHCLHEGVGRGWTDELPATLLEILRERDGYLRRRLDLLRRISPLRLERQEVGSE